MLRPLLSLGVISGLLAISLPAAARPELASGDQLLNTDVAGCLAAADQLIQGLAIEFSQGSMDRTGYFQDGAFRIVCYGADEGRSLAVVFASHAGDRDAVADFIQRALTALRQIDSPSEATLAPSAQAHP